MTALVPNLDIANAGQSEYFSFTAPSGTGSTLALDVQSGGLSLLAPKVTVYAANGSTVLASASGAGQYGTTLTVSVPNVTAGETILRAGAGGRHDADGDGQLCPGLEFQGSGPARKGVAHRGRSQRQSRSTPAADRPTVRTAMGPTSKPTPVITGIMPDNGVSSQDGITNNANIAILGTAAAADTSPSTCNGSAIGQTIALPNNQFMFINSANPLDRRRLQFHGHGHRSGRLFHAALLLVSSGHRHPRAAASRS